MKLGIIQPHYLPYSGYFSLIKYVDKFIFHDDVDYISGEWKNRNKIKINKSSTNVRWLTVPVEFKNKGLIGNDKFINKIKIAQENGWQKKHLNYIKNAYGHCVYFDEIIKIIEEVFNYKEELLSDLNIKLIKKIMQYLEINTETFQSSNFKLNNINKTEKLIHLCKITSCTNYIANNKSIAYLDESKFEKNKIQLIYQNFKHPIYEQDNHNFISNLSILDLLMYHGKNSNKFI